MWQNYIIASTLDEALTVLAEQGSRARIIAGGTDLILEMERGLHPEIETLIDITRVKGLDDIRLEDGFIKLGPLVNHNHVAVNELMRQYAPQLAQACWEVGAPQIRNRGTVVGNLITASPANDSIVPLFTLDAELTLKSLEGERQIKIQDFYTGLRKTVLQANEIVKEVRFPVTKATDRGVFLKLGLRRAQAISIVSVAVRLSFEDGLVSDARIALGSVAPTVIRVLPAEQSLIGQELDEALIKSCASIAANYPSPINDIRSTANYRVEMIKVLVYRALMRLFEHQTGDLLPDEPAMLWGAHQAKVQEAYPEITEVHTGDAISAYVNDEAVQAKLRSGMTLLDWLRDSVGLKGTKEGCAEGECGACTVLLDGVAVMSCLVAAERAQQAQIKTVESLQENQEYHAIQSAFIDEAAVQCGYCTPGFLMSGAQLLKEHPSPTEAQICQSISGNLCRCTGYYSIINAFKLASQVDKDKEEMSYED